MRASEFDQPARFNNPMLVISQMTAISRKVTDWPTPLGAIRFEVTYGDYRDAGKGVKVPFLVQMIPATPRMEQSVVATVRVQKVEENVPIDDGKFAKPESKAAQPR